MEYILDFLSGRPSAQPSPSSRKGKRKNEDGCSGTASGNTQSVGSASARRAAEKEEGVHGILTSALWAVARTPALVEAIERANASFGEVSSPLSCILDQLRHAGDADNLPEAAKAAHAFLRDRRLTFYDSMEPMEAIRSIVGLCVDSDRVLQEAVGTTYRTFKKCTIPGCAFKRVDCSETEEKLVCKNGKVQLSIELRSNSSKKEHMCETCDKLTAAKRYVLEKAAPCLVATWPALQQAEAGQDILIVSNCAVQYRFKLGVMIVNHLNKFVCLFRKGSGYYRVEGRRVKETSKSEWQDARPCLALFNRQDPSGNASPRSRSPRGTGLPRFASNGGEQAGRKRSRQQIGHGHRQLSKGSSSSSSSSRARGAVAAAAAEVIEVDDDDSDRGGADTSPLGGRGGGGRDASDRPNGHNGGDGADVSGEKGAAANGTVGKGEKRNRDGGREEAGAGRTPQQQAVDVDRSNACEEAPLAEKSAKSAATGGGGRSGARARAAGPEPTAAVQATISGSRNRNGRDAGRGTGSSPGAAVTPSRREDQETPRERDRRQDPDGLPRVSPLSNGSPRGSRMRQDGSPGEVGRSGTADNASSCGRSQSLASGTASSARQRPCYLDDSERPARAGRADLTAETTADSLMDVEGEDDNNNDDDDDDDVQMVGSGRPNPRRGEESGRESSAVSSASSTPAAAGAGSSSSSSAGSGWRWRRTSDSSPQRDSERGARGTVPSGSLDSSPPTRLREREVHDVDDHASPPAPPPAPRAPPNGKKHPSGVSMPFIGPPRPPEPDDDGGDPLIGPARPPQPKAGALPPRPRPPVQQQASDAPWFKRNTKPAGGGGGGGGSGSSHEAVRRKTVAAASANRGARRAGGKGIGNSGGMGGGGGGGAAAAKGAGRQTMIPSWWEKTNPPFNNASANSSRGGGSGSGSSSFGKSVQRKPAGNGAVVLGTDGGGGSGYRLGRGSGDGGGGSRQGRLHSGKKVMEDLTGADESWQEMEDGKGAGGWGSGFMSGAGGNETLTTIRGINLQHDHFDRILDSDGWLTSQIIDIRVKQLQERYPQHLYFDTSFFGFLCPSTERGGAFVVDYARVAGWTKSSRLPGGKSSLFEMQKLFIPINQGNVHWVLVVVDMNGGGSGGGGSGSSSAKMVSFFDSFGREGTTYVEAVQQYLVSELSSRDKTRQELFAPRARPPANAPRQHNSSDCGVIMLHVMEELSTGPASELTRLTQEEVMSLRLQLVAKIRE